MKKIYAGLSILLFGLLLCGGTVAATSIGVTYDETEDAADTPKELVSYEIYEPFGLQYEPSKDELYFEGELVRYFYDGVDVDGGQAVRCEFLNEKGNVDIYTARETIDNGDGSINPFGKLTRIERYSQEEFDKRDFTDFYGSVNHAVMDVSGNYDPSGESFADRFAKYKEIGIVFIESKTASGVGNVYYEDELVNTFIDILPDGGTFSFQSADNGKFNIQTVYDKNGKLIGAEK